MNPEQMGILCSIGIVFLVVGVIFFAYINSTTEPITGTGCEKGMYYHTKTNTCQAFPEIQWIPGQLLTEPLKNETKVWKSETEPEGVIILDCDYGKFYDPTTKLWTCKESTGVRVE